jgi:nucleotide-binding universal stress UspA family protein
MSRRDEADVFPPLTQAGYGGRPFQRICVPVGPAGPPGRGHRTLTLAAMFGAACGGKLRVVHVRMWDPAVRGGGGRFYLETSEEATAVLDWALTSAWACGVEASGVVVDAPRQRVGRAIAVAAHSWGAEVIVVPRRRRSALGVLLFGSLPDEMVRQAGCPVLVC